VLFGNIVATSCFRGAVDSWPFEAVDYEIERLGRAASASARTSRRGESVPLCLLAGKPTSPTIRTEPSGFGRWIPAMWAPPAWRLAGLLIAMLGCTEPNPAYRRGPFDGSVPAEHDGEAAPSDGLSSAGGAPGTQGGDPATDATFPPPDDVGTPGPDGLSPSDGFIADRPADGLFDRPATETAPADVALVDQALGSVDAPVPPREEGLLGSYFDGTQLENGTPGCLDLQRVDKVIDFDWPVNVRPGPNMDHDNFSVRWTGQLEPTVSGMYTFTTRTDDGVRLYLDDVLVLENWTAVGANGVSAMKTLVANRRYAIRMEYRESTGAAAARLSWTPPGQPTQVIPKEVLIPAPRYQAALNPGCKPTPP
jgi:hypothetical protein